MILSARWILKIVFVLAAVSFQTSYAAIIYVNINNPTPGTGTSWATAYNDLNAALSSANYNDELWVAKGTYKPTATTDRTISFQVYNQVLLYGGFAGTETSRNQRNVTTNATILSGDIGVAGDMTDNSYNVITVNYNYGEDSISGFTIEYGNGNQNYPSTSAYQPYNQAGGMLFKAAASITPSNYGYTGAYVDSCIFLSNFGVYGGAACALGDATSTSGTGYATIEVTMAHDLFQNNSSVIGGTVCWLTVNGGAGLLEVESSIFNNNNSVAGGASGAGLYAINPPTGAYFNIGYRVDNSTFYNNPAPIFSNNVAIDPTYNTFSKMTTLQNILWQASGYYGGSLTTGTVSLTNSDVDLATPGSGNINGDPLFVNAPGGDFHLQTCSPDVDAGGSVPSSPNDFAGSPRVQGTAIDWGAYETSKTISPTVYATAATYCQNATASAITAGSGVNLLWYTTATGGTGSSVDPIPATTTVGSTQYWLTQTISGECESTRTPVTITIQASPAAPATTDEAYCQNTTATALTATGTSLEWYTAATGGTGSIIAPTPSTTAIGATTWYVTQTNSNNCESPRASLTVTINSIPAAPVTTDETYCQNATAAALTATGTSLLWYTAASGGTGSATAPTPSTTTTGSTTWYVSQTIGCESPRAAIAVAVDANAPAPTATDETYCQGTTAAALTASGSNLLWYTAATGGTGDATAPTPSTSTVGSTSWYVTQTPTGSCESTRTPVMVTIDGASAAPTATSPTYCEGVTATALTATGNNLLWYTAATGGTGDPSAPTPSTSMAGMTTWYVTQTPTGDCESLRVPVTVTIDGPSAAPTATSPAYCVGSTATSLTATGSNLLWYTVATGGTGDASAPTPSTSAVGSTTWYVSQTPAGDCESSRAAVTVVINANPTVTVGSSEVDICAGDPVKLEAFGATDYSWTPSASLSDSSASEPIVIVQTSTLYTVTGTTDGCSGTATVQVTIKADCLVGYFIPNAFTPNGDGQNDVFRVRATDVPKAFSMQVFNRYGGRVFETENVGDGWNGSVGGVAAQTGAYVYVVVLTNSGGTVMKKEGTVMLIR